MLNKQKGNMYPWVTHTWNPIKGKCPYQCSYCYYQNNPCFKSKIGKLRLDEKALKDNLSEGNFVFVGSSCDMFAQEVKTDWILDVLNHCNLYNNTYLFQSKNTMRMAELINYFPNNFIAGTTIETNRYYEIGNAPNRMQRFLWIEEIRCNNFDVMVSIEPILDFDLDIIVNWIKRIHPKSVSIGADSQNHHLPEPSPEKVEALIKELSKFTEVKVKDNLKRLRKNN